MLRDEDIRIDVGRSIDGDFIRVVHIPSGIKRHHPGPLTDLNRNELLERWRYEIEEELLSRSDKSKSPEHE
jgi:hypothetical protein